MKRILIIGGTDSSGGAGLTRDVSVARDLGFDALPIVTAVTAQTHGSLLGAELMSADIVALQIAAALDAGEPAAIKIGMLGSGQIAEAVADALAGAAGPVVIDPVLASSSGGSLMSGHLPQRLLSRARLITPNRIEAAALSGHPIATHEAQIAHQAGWFLANGVQGVLIKGGHADGPEASDHLFERASRQVFSAPRLNAKLRGTGCALATAIACHLAEGHSLPRSCQKAKSFVHRQLLQASTFRAERNRSRTHREIV